MASATVATILAEAIRDLGRVPSGHLYARVMGHLSMEAYNSAISILKMSDLVEERSHELIWIGPPKA